MTGPFPGVSRETSDRLTTLADLVRKWSPRINLVAKADLPHLAERHILDSLQIWSLAPVVPRLWGDLGSGGGFPALVAAICAKEQGAPTAFTLIESDQRKCVFLRTAIRDLDLNARVVVDRIEDTAPLGADVVSARALMPLDRLLGAVTRHLHPEGCAILPKGQSAQEEIDRARRIWSFDLEARPSATSSAARILLIKRIARV